MISDCKSLKILASENPQKKKEKKIVQFYVALLI